jgi:hypothetical protein
MKRLVAKGGAANSINMLTRVLLVDDQSRVNIILLMQQESQARSFDTSNHL